MMLNLILAAVIGGAFPLLCTSYTEEGEVVLKKRGVFPNTLSRIAKKTGGWALEDVRLTTGEIAEIDARLKFAGIE